MTLFRGFQVFWRHDPTAQGATAVVTIGGVAMTVAGVATVDPGLVFLGLVALAFAAAMIWLGRWGFRSWP